jgi:hypothetical protein
VLLGPALDRAGVYTIPVDPQGSAAGGITFTLS